MYLGEAIEKIRQEKGMPVTALIGDKLSKSSYSRFVNNKSMISIDKLLYLLDQLHMTFAMFLHIYTNYFDLKYDYCHESLPRAEAPASIG